MQVIELSTCAGHAADFGDAKCKTGFVTTVIVADQLAFPVAKKVTGILARATWAEVVHHGADLGERRRGIAPNISTLGFLIARREHLHRRFIDMHHVVLKHDLAQGIDQRLQLHTASADPIGQR